MKQRLASWMAIAAMGISVAAPAQTSPQSLPSIRLSIGIRYINAELAQTEEQREIGLMFRQALGTNDGMIFVFDQPGQQCFWMKNTLIPLDAAFIGDDGAVINIERMAPQTLDNHCSDKPARYVLEMNDGWFEKRGIRAGQKIKGLLPIR